MKVFTIGGLEYSVVKKGVGQARQLAGATRWLSKYGAPTFRKLIANGGIGDMSGFELAITFLGEMDEASLLELFSVVFGCPLEASETEFDVAMLVEGLQAVYEEVPAIRKLADRFFSESSSMSTEDSSSTPSESPTAG